MIKFTDGELLDILPAGIKKDVNVRCLSYALKQAMARLLKYETQTYTFNFIDQLPERILDVLAVEFCVPYYLQDMEIDLKRELIKSAMMWHSRAGTVGAVLDLAKLIFGESVVEEWYDYGGEPYHFQIATDALLNELLLGRFTEVLKNIKNVRSWMDSVKVHREADVGYHACLGECRLFYAAPIRMEG